MANFVDSLKSELGETLNVAYSENGATSYQTTTSALLDMSFDVSSLRSKSEAEIQKQFSKVFYEDKISACKFLFYEGDVREGNGERRLFRICMTWLANNEPKIARALLTLIPEYTRWDNVLCLLGTELKNDVVAMIKTQLELDLHSITENQPISLCSKWMPSCSASSKATRDCAIVLRHAFGWDEATYRKTLSKLRAQLNLVEISMSSKKWSEINYSGVPSRANLVYNSAFLRNDEERRREFLEKLKSGDDPAVKINASVLFPQDVVHNYGDKNGHRRNIGDYDETLEQLWKNLKDTVQGASNILVVADSSGSMMSPISSASTLTALEAATALAIYFSEHLTGIYKDKFITFSSRPQFVDLSNCTTLRDKVAKAYGYNLVEDTDIEKTFDLILNAAIANKLSQEELPSHVLVLSDMEFNRATVGRPTQKLFQVINQKFVEAGYKMMKLVFWNLNSRSGAIPVKADNNGFPAILVSGFSTNIVKMVLNGELDPLKALLKELNTERYEVIGELIKTLI